ncbi:NUDIX domain-containing protein [Nocardia sp. NPDC048505]|uniref:NUDIX hydrolase n=1 Tax=Nocardia sp. NPDC048505 TaxID=3155756 RepID=UPI003401BE2B
MTEGSQIIIYHPARHAVLMYLRDDKPSIPFPDMWALPGGMLEPSDKTPKECVLREIEEEMELILDPATVQAFARRDCDFGIEHTFTTSLELDIDELALHEGQRLGWFTAQEAAETELAYADNDILRQFFSRKAVEQTPGADPDRHRTDRHDQQGTPAVEGGVAR